MDLAGAQKLAHRLHRGESDEAGGAYTDHLARVAALVASEGGDVWQQMAAWLHGSGRAGVTLPDLLTLGVPRRVAQIVGAVASRQPWEPAEQWVRRVRSCRRAALVLRTDMADLARPEARAVRPGTWEYRADHYRSVLSLAGIPVPQGLASPDPAAGPAGHAPPSRLVADDPRRWEAVRAARSTGDLRASGPLIDAYLAAAAGDPRWAGGRAQIAAALSQIAAHRRHQDDAWWVQKLVSLSGHPDDFLRATAIRGLAGLAGHQDLVVHALADHSPQVVDAALGSLTGTAGLAGTLTQIAGRLESAWTWPRRHAVRLLLEGGHPQARDAILAALAADGPGLGHDMLRLLARHADPSVIPVLVSQLRSGARGRAAAAWLLGELHASEAAGELAMIVADSHADLQVQLASIEALGKLADPATIPALASATRHDSAWVRQAALVALSKTAHPDIAQVALTASEDFDPGVRDRAVRILAARGGREATARLLSFCDGPQAGPALRGLARIGDERAVPLLTQVFRAAGDRQTRHLAGRALAVSARRAPALYETTLMTPAQVSAIAWVLGEIGDKTSCRQLTRLLAHRDALVRARAAAALGKIADPGAAPDLRTALADIAPRVRASAATALGRLGQAEAMQWLVACSQDPHPAVRSAADAAVRRLQVDTPTAGT